MGDMLVNLTKLPSADAEVERLASEGIVIRRLNPWDITPLRRFIEKHFGVQWADEALNAFGHQPPTCVVATDQRKIIGFAAFGENRTCALAGRDGLPGAQRRAGPGPL